MDCSAFLSHILKLTARYFVIMLAATVVGSYGQIHYTAVLQSRLQSQPLVNKFPFL